MRDRPLTDELLDLIGAKAMFDLVVSYGGTRLYVPRYRREATAEIEGLGTEASRSLAEAFGGLLIRVPLCREFKLVVYEGRGLSNAQIAVKLGITETGVGKIKRRVQNGTSVSGARLSKGMLRLIEAGKTVPMDSWKVASEGEGE